MSDLGLSFLEKLESKGSLPRPHLQVNNVPHQTHDIQHLAYASSIHQGNVGQTQNHSIPNKPTLAALKTGLDFYRHYLQRHKKCGFLSSGISSTKRSTESRFDQLSYGAK